MTDKHLLYWVLKAIDACRSGRVGPDTLLSETLWKNLGAPDWVLPAMQEKYAEFRSSHAPDSVELI
jgi:hypothetical protein